MPETNEKKRGRPTKEKEEVIDDVADKGGEPAAKRGRGRPKGTGKAKTPVDPNAPKRPRGRPKGASKPKAASPKKRGPPKKAAE